MIYNAKEHFPKSAAVYAEDNMMPHFRTRLDINVVFYESTDNGYTLKENYNIKNNAVVVSQTVGSWSNESGLRAYDRDWRRRRANLRGVVLHDSLVRHTVLTQFETADGKVVIEGTKTGMFQEILQHMQAEMNFTTEVILPPSTTFGRKKNGSWVGLMGMLVDKRADIVTAGAGN